MKCCLCKRDANRKLFGHDWMCTFHFNKLIRDLRIKRKLSKRPILTQSGPTFL